MTWNLTPDTFAGKRIAKLFLLWLLSSTFLFAQPTVFQCAEVELCSATNSCDLTTQLALDFNSACPITDVHIYAYVDENNDASYDYIASSIIPFPLTNSANLPVQPLEIINTSSEAYTALLPETTYDFGYHSVSWRGKTTACNFIMSCYKIYEVVDCTPPILEIEYVFTEPATAGCGFSFSADEFVVQFTDNCAIDTVIAIYPSLGPGQTYPPFGRLGSTINWCPGIGTNVMDVWAFDQSGNVSYAQGVLIITDNNQDDCCHYYHHIVEIEVLDPDGNRIPEVEFGFYGTAGPPIPADYYFTTVSVWDSEDICPEKKDDPRNGVSGVDLIILARALMGIADFTSHYQRIAADADGDGEITFFDITQIQNVILHNDENFPNEASWKFLPAEYTFAESLQSLSLADFPNCYPVEPYSYFSDPIPMIGVKTGDLNFSAKAKESIEKQIHRSEKNITAADQFLQAGQRYSIPFYTEIRQPGLGFQLDLALAEQAMEFVDLALPADWQGGHHWDQETGQLSMTYFNPRTAVGEMEQPIFELSVNMKSNGWLSDFVKLDEVQIAPEWYGEDLHIETLALAFEEWSAVHQSPTIPKVSCYPNPSNGQPIQFKFFEAYNGPILFTFFNAQGQLIYEKEIFNQAGNQWIEIEPNIFPAGGIYFYLIDLASDTIQGRLVITN